MAGMALLVLGLLLSALAAAWLVGWWRALCDTVAHARAVSAGQLGERQEPRQAALREITRALNTLARRQREGDAAQAAQVAALQRQAQTDTLTGLPLRAQFIGRLGEQLAGPGGPACALVLVRLPDLDLLNRRLGHEGADRMLQVLAELLQAYVQRVPGTFGGRLNGADFALCLPVPGVAAETAASLHAALAAAPALRTGGAVVLVAAADGLRGLSTGAALAAADAALARAEMGQGLAVEQPGDSAADPAGARVWHAQIAAALEQGRVRLDAVRVGRQDGQLVHLACSLRVQLLPGGSYEAATRWLALARRSRLMPQVDLAALELALAAITADARPRAVHFALPSLGDPGFADAVSARLARAPQAARLLCIEWDDDAAALDLGHLAQGSAPWRQRGVRVGVRHAGAPGMLARWRACGVSYVRVEACHLRGVASDAAVRAYAQGLLTLVHGLGLAALAEGVADADDVALLWSLGYDGTGGVEPVAVETGTDAPHESLVSEGA
jgi:GGDEF domain-containing protein